MLTIPVPPSCGGGLAAALARAPLLRAVAARARNWQQNGVSCGRQVVVKHPLAHVKRPQPRATTHNKGDWST